MDSIKLITFIYGIIGLIVLVCFFYLCNNVSKIKNTLEKWDIQKQSLKVKEKISYSNV